jgi:hypothetical protein
MTTTELSYSKIANTENLYGVGCDSEGNCVLTGASVPAANGYSVGPVTGFVNGTLQNTRTAARTNGFGRTICGQNLDRGVGRRRLPVLSEGGVFTRRGNANEAGLLRWPRLALYQ